MTQEGYPASENAASSSDAIYGYEVRDGLPRCQATCRHHDGEFCTRTDRSHGLVCEPALLRALSEAHIGFEAPCGPVDAGNGTCG